MTRTQLETTMRVIFSLSVVILGLVARAEAEAEELPPDMAISKSGKILPYKAIVPLSAGPKTVEYDTTGMRPMTPLPPPGVHPRILHSPEDREMLVKAYAETPYGQFVWELVKAWTDKLKGNIKDRSDYPTFPDGTMMGPFSRGGWTETAEAYRKVNAGDMSPVQGNHMNSHLLGLVCLELYRCWVEEAEPAGKEAATVLAEIATHLAKSYKPGTHVGAIGAYHMGFGYDYGHGFMTDVQRDTIRRLIAAASRNKAHYGAFTECDATTSNWCTLDSFQPFTMLAIEGEEGFNENYYRSFVEAYQKFITYGWYKSGVPYEGLGKNYQFNVTMMILSRRGVNLTGHPHVKAYGKQFLTAACLPNARGGFIGCDDWGGTGGDTTLGNYRFNITDVVGLKWLFPEDKQIDYMWQTYVGENFRNLNDLRPVGYFPALLLAAMFPSEALVEDTTRDKAELPLTLFCPERGYLLTRSDNSEDALMLTFHCRQDKGGHTSADRGNFTFSALGRLWGYQMNLAGGSKFGKVNESRFFSTVLIDDVGQCGMASGCFPVPGKVVDFQDNEMVTYACGDAKYAYDWEWHWEDGEKGKDSPKLAEGWEKVLETPNDFQYKRIPLDYMDKPFYEQSHWLQPGMVQHYVKKPWNPVKRAFRTVALIRGKHPYALIVDDIEASDGEQHQYKWLMQASKDLEILQFDFSDTSDICDIILCGREVARVESGERRPTKGDPMLLVRVLQCNNDMRQRRYTPIGRIEQYMANIRWPKTYGKRLVIPSYSVAPDYKVMLFPYRYGDKLPETKWLDKDKTRLELRRPEMHEEIIFSKGDNGRTAFNVLRDGKAITAVSDDLLEIPE